jgi:pyridoxal 5'-phosphate synthase pdxT subunit
MNIGILAIQGDYDAHRAVLERLGATPFFVRMPEHLEQAEGLIIPGGESSTFLKLLGQYSFLDKLKAFVQTRPTFGTCAGAILLAKEVLGPRQSSLGALDIRIRRNAYGRQLESSIREGWLNGRPLEMVFIRAPKIEQAGRGVDVLVREGDGPVLVREDNVMAATFHPELTNDTRVHEMFLELVRNRHAKRGVAVVAENKLSF